VGGYIPPYVDKGTNHLYGKCGSKDSTYEMRDMKIIHHVEADEVANDRNDIRYHSSLALSELEEFPTVIVIV